MMRRLAVVVAVTTVAVVVVGAAGSATRPSGWLRFGYDAARTNSRPETTGITAANVAKLRRRQFAIDGTVDSSPLLVSGAVIRGHARDAIVFTTTYGKTEAIDVMSGAVLWRFVPPNYGSVAETAQITTMTPLIDPEVGAVYAGASDGRIRRLSLADGHVEWTTSITRDPTKEKLASALNMAGGLILAATDGYIGDAPSYQGHVVSLNAATGKIVAVWNSLCSERHALQQPVTCPESGSAIWGRSAPVVDPTTGHLLVATGNGVFDGKRYWGDSLLVLSANASTLLAHWTPADQSRLNDADLDVGSTAPALLDGGFAVQGGKDGELRLLNLAKLPGVNSRLGGEVQTVDLPGRADLFSVPAVWQGRYVFVANANGTQAWLLTNSNRLSLAWNNANAGTSPVVAGGLVYVQADAGIRVYEATTGTQLAVLPIGDTHWQTPVIVGGRVIAAEDNANTHSLTGTIDVFALAGR